MFCLLAYSFPFSLYSLYHLVLFFYFPWFAELIPEKMSTGCIWKAHAESSNIMWLLNTSDHTITWETGIGKMNQKVSGWQIPPMPSIGCASVVLWTLVPFSTDMTDCYSLFTLQAKKLQHWKQRCKEAKLREKKRKKGRKKRRKKWKQLVYFRWWAWSDLKQL